MNGRFLETAITMDKLSPKEGELLLLVQQSYGDRVRATRRCGELAVSFGLLDSDAVDAVLREQRRLTAEPMDLSEWEHGPYVLIPPAIDAGTIRARVEALEHSFGVSLADEDWREFFEQAREALKARAPMAAITPWVEKRLREKSARRSTNMRRTGEFTSQERLRASAPQRLVWVCGAVVIGAALGEELLIAACATAACVVCVAYLARQRARKSSPDLRQRH